MFAYKNKYYLYIDNTSIINLNLIKIRKKYSVIYRNFNKQENIDILKNNQINKANNAGACYIATLVYGDYDDPQVIVLRAFRDNVLAMSFFGRCFISFYYLVSPSLVEVLRHQYLIQKITRKVLNLLVKELRK